MRYFYKKFSLGLLLFVLITTTANAQIQPTGSGTGADPYQIATLDNLLWVSTNSSSWTSVFIQTADIDATDTQNWNGGEGFIPIGNSTTNFSGSYNGQGYSINGLYINRPSHFDQGLFGFSGGTLDNTNLTNVNINGDSGVGALVGFNSVHTINNCTSSGYVTGTTDRVGGLVGESNGGWTQAYVTNCHSSCHVSGGDNVGGLVGQSSRSAISYCSGSGSVSGSEKVGGLVGYSIASATITNSFSTGSVSGNNNVGGLAGTCGVTAVNNCYSRSNVNGVSHVAGLVGFGHETNIWNCYSTGIVTGTGSYVGGLVGEIYWFASVDNSFWDYETSGTMSSPGGGTGKTSDEMKDVATFTNETTAGLSYAWDFVGNPHGDTGNDDYWDIDGYNNQGYPYLSYQFTSPLQADFFASNTTISLGDNIHFTDLSTGTPISWEWDFQNDGTIDSYDQNPEYVYSESGINSVSLLISDGIYSDFSNKIDYIIVVDCNPTMGILPGSLDFGMNEITPDKDTLSSWLKNTSNCQLYINDLFGLQQPYSYDTTGMSSASILPGDSLEIPVILNKDFAVGTYTDTLIISTGTSQNIDLEDGLVAWYPFNGNANDESGNGHNGNAQGAQLSTDRFGNNNSAYDFDGHDDWISAGNWFTYQDFTISVWVKQDAINSTYVDIIDNNHSGSANWVIQHDQSTGDYVFYTAPLGATAFTLPNNQWKHLVFIKDGLSLKTYMNGILQDELTATSSTINYSNPYLQIGRWYGGSRNFNGKIDDIRMYDRGLTEDEVEALYNENNGIEGYPQLIVQAELVESVGLEVDITAFFEGPFNGTDMNADLNSILPIEQPYNVYPWEYNGGENVASIPNSDIVDWLLVEFRDAADVNSATSATSLGGQAAFILMDGSIVDLNGNSTLSFDYTISENLFVVLWHRNHLPVLSANQLAESGGIYSYDFTTAADQAYSDNQSDLGGGKFGMIGGDANADGTINELDGIEAWYPQIGQSGYLSGDVNMDGQVNNPDKNDVWLSNYGKSEQLPAAGFTSCGDDIIDARDGQSYSTLQIGTQCWMTENLNIGTMINGSNSPSNNPTIEKYCYDDNTANCDLNGGFYQWDEMMEYGSVAGSQGICPAGWHIPSHPEWCIMEQLLDPTVVCDDVAWRGTDIGTQFKQGGTSGFEAILAGGRYWDGTFQNFGVYTYFWSSSLSGSTSISRHLVTTQTGVYRANNTKTFAFSIRCVKD